MKKAKRRYVMTARAAKAEATRERIVAAAIALYRKFPLDDFILADVADHAGTTVQTVLRTFGSKDQLLFAALHAMADEGSNLKVTRPGDVATAIREIYGVYETMGDFVIQRLAEEHRLPASKAVLDRGRHNHRDWVAAAFAPQLEHEPAGRRMQLLSILIGVTDVYFWKVLRRDLGLERRAAEAAAQRIIAGVTQQEMEHGEERGTDPVAELVGRRQPAA